jgi:uroporphyrin-III C-methyltransferase/precorrin-2 dehydrogenase/sirohydrochlorin ferrochelatase
MGIGRLAAIAEELAGAEFSPDTPVAIVENGNRPGQRILRGALSDLSRIAAKSGVRSPAILFVGRSAAVLPFANSGESPDEAVAHGG